MWDQPIVAWALFNAVVIVLLVFDLLVIHRKEHEIKMREALAWSAFWIALALGFNALIYPMYHHGWFGFGQPDTVHALSGKDAALQFLTGYLIEKSLSVDNLFVFLAIFNYFQLNTHYQHRVLFWGILGAVVLRAIMILAGVALIHQFHWLIYVLGAFLIFTGGKLAFERGEQQVDPEHSFVLKTARRWLPIAPGDHEGKFFKRVDGKLMFTSLMLVLISVEFTDVVFALDSIPAILAITKDPFIAYTSNICAILGLRALYFALAGLMGLFHYLRFGLAAVLIFVGGKMMAPLVGLPHVPVAISLAVVGSLLGVSILASIVWVKEQGGIDAVADSADDEQA